MIKNTRKMFSVTLLVGALSLSACASDKANNAEIYDPLEGVNRTTLKMNEVADKAILKPVAQGYRAVTPEAGRTVVSNFLRNLNSPVIIGNELLQGDLEGAGNATARLVINTLAGFGGILDLAADGGIEHQPEDFGQTLATWGVGDGMYVVLPLMGPSSLRDASGRMVDSFADPLRTYLFNIDDDHLHYTRVGATVVSEREALIEVIDDLRRNSFDYYAALRSAYVQRRQALINDQGANGAMEIPDYDDF